MTEEPTTPCVPAVMKHAYRGKKPGDWCDAPAGMYHARKALLLREGPPPFPKAVCRHLCKNDSQAKNGFVCVKHTVWGTYTENAMDKDPEVRKQRGRHVAAVVNALPPVTCPYCGKTGAHSPMMQHHFDRCKHKPSTSSVSQPDT